MARLWLYCARSRLATCSRLFVLASHYQQRYRDELVPFQDLTCPPTENMQSIRAPHSRRRDRHNLPDPRKVRTHASPIASLLRTIQATGLLASTYLVRGRAVPVLSNDFITRLSPQLKRTEPLRRQISARTRENVNRKKKYFVTLMGITHINKKRLRFNHPRSIPRLVEWMNFQMTTSCLDGVRAIKYIISIMSLSLTKRFDWLTVCHPFVRGLDEYVLDLDYPFIQRCLPAADGLFFSTASSTLEVSQNSSVHSSQGAYISSEAAAIR